MARFRTGFEAGFRVGFRAGFMAGYRTRVGCRAGSGLGAAADCDHRNRTEQKKTFKTKEEHIASDSFEVRGVHEGGTHAL